MFSWKEMRWNVSGNIEIGSLDSELELCSRCHNILHGYDCIHRRYTLNNLHLKNYFDSGLENLGSCSMYEQVTGPNV